MEYITHILGLILLMTPFQLWLIIIIALICMAVSPAGEANYYKWKYIDLKKGLRRGKVKKRK